MPIHLAQREMINITVVNEFDGNNPFRRNNRSNGQKSLRCFPRCCEQGHKKSGFCGKPIYATAIFQKTFPLERIIIVGEFRPETEPGLVQQMGRELHREEIMKRIRSEQNNAQTNMLLPGSIRILNADETTDTYSASIVLNESLHSYNYDWKSNRWTALTVRHVIDIVVLSDDSDTCLTVLGGVSSNSFLILSTKKSQATNVSEDETTGKKRKGASSPEESAHAADDDYAHVSSSSSLSSSSSSYCTTKESPSYDASVPA